MSYWGPLDRRDGQDRRGNLSGENGRRSGVHRTGEDSGWFRSRVEPEYHRHNNIPTSPIPCQFQKREDQ